MKTLKLTCILLGGIAIGYAQEKPNKEHLIAVFASSEEIDGTLLSKWNSFYTDSKDGARTYDCTIGYTQDIGGQSTFVPVLDLPRLKEDERYNILCENGVLTIRTVKGKAFVARLDLNSLAPGLITKRRAEQAGTGQPATRPESKSEGSKKPQPEAEGRSR